MQFLKYAVALAMALNLAACGDQAENQGAVQASAVNEAASTDPRYQNPLLNANPEQFNEVLADCGKLLFGEQSASDEVQAKCKQDMIARAAKLGLTITEADIAEQLVKDRFHFVQSKQQ
ncbi:hypothetical protein [Chitinibacter sp. S2-10]|uniref:hypothetical protein n=1 Tax=Chitinibacter sp. S2-10 TaxID=3373597 RepID=UPI00397760A5